MSVTLTTEVTTTVSRPQLFGCVEALVTEEVQGGESAATDFLQNVVARFTPAVVIRLLNSEAGLAALRESGWHQGETAEVETDEDAVHEFVREVGIETIISDLGVEDEVIDFVLNNHEDACIETLRDNGSIPNLSGIENALDNIDAYVQEARQEAGL